MYRMLYNDSFLFDPFDETRIVSSASITTNVNAASYLDFTIAANHPLYSEIEQRSGIITLYSDNETLFQGQITSIDMDMDGNKSVTCSSALDWLRDVQLRPYSTDQEECNEYEFKLDKAPDALDAYFQWLIDQYNAQNKDGRYFTINVNQAADLTNRNIVYFSSTSPRSVADAIEQDILGTFGGYLVLRYEDNQLILDLYSDIHEMNEQVIDYGENILDISRTESTDDQYTAVYPIGATPQYTAEQQKYHDEKDAYDERMKQREETEKAAIDKLKKEEEAEQNRIIGMPKGQAKTNAQNALKRRKEQRQAREKAFSDETKRLQDEQKIKDDKNAADKTKPNPITIESLDNGGYEGDLDIFKEGDVIYSVSYVQRYGYKEFVYSDTDVDDKKLLLKLAVAKLKTLMAPVLTIDVRAVDQALYNPKHTHLFAGQAVRVRSKPHGVDEFMMVSSIDLDLIDPSQTTATLGVAYDTLTGQQSSFLRNLNSQIVASVDAVDKLGEDVKVTEITLGRVETVVDNVAADNELIVNTVGDYKWMTDTAWGKAEDAQESADEANQSVTDTNVRIDNLKLATDERIDGMETDISGIHDSINNTKAEIVTIKENAEQIRQDAQAGIDEAKQQAEQIRQDAQAGIDEAKQQAENIRTEANTAIGDVRTDLAATEAKAELARKNASSALGGLSSANAQINGLRIDVNRHNENIINMGGEIVGVKDTISGVAETANSALTVATTNTQAINEQSTRIDTAYSDIEATRTSVSEVKQTADGLKVNLETNYLDKDALGANYASKAELNATSESITSTVEKTYATKSALEGLQNIADAAIETWSGQTVPTASNPPASTWATDALKRQHSGDIYYDMSTGKSYRWGSADGKVYSWSMIADSDITKAIADAAKAQQTADGAKQDVVNLSNDVKATYTSKSEFKQTSDEIKASVSEVASANEANTKKIADVSVKADGISATVKEQATTIAGHTTTIGQLSVKADGLQTKFEQVSDDLGHVRGSIPGLINPNFTDGDYGWIHNGGSFRISTYDASLNGPYLVGENFSENGTYELINKGLLSLAPGHKYRISILMHVNTNILRDNRLSLRFIKTYSPYVDYPNAVAYINTADITDNQFVTYSREITCPAKVTQGYFRLGAITKAGSNSYISVKSVDIVDITEGSAALTKTSQLEQNLDGFKQTVTESYLKKGDADTKYTSKSEFTQTANELRGTIQEQAETLNGHTTTIGNLSMKADGLQTKFEQVSDDLTELTDNLDGLINPSFSTNSMYGWTIRPTDKARMSSYDREPGGPYLVIDSSNAIFLATIINDGILTFAPKHRYRVTVMMKVTHAEYFSSSEGITIRLAKPNYTNMSDWVDGFYANVPKSEVGTTWKSYSKDIVIGEYGATGHLRLAFQPTANTGAAFALKSVKIEDITEANTALTKTSELQQNLDGFKQTVSETYTTKDEFDNLQIGGRNLLLNTKTSKQVVGNNGTNQGMTLYTLSTHSWAHLDPGEYMISADISYEGTISGKFTFQRDNKPWGFTPSASKNFADIITDSKRKAHVEFLVTNAYDGASKGLGVRFDNVQGTVTFSNMKLEKGNKATTWSPAPEDLLDTATASTTYTTKSEFTQTANEIKGTVAEQATTIAGHTNTIGTLSLKADKFETDISQVTEQATAIAGRTTKLEQNLDGFKQTVSGTYITKTDAEQNLVDAINGIQIGGSNMLLDTRAFGSANPNKIPAHGFSLNSAAQNGTYNQFTYRRIPDTVTTNNPGGPSYDNISIERGKTYTASFYYRGTADLLVYFYGPSGYVGCVATTASNGTTNNSVNGNDGNVTFTKDSEWKRYWVTWTLHKTGGSHLRKHLLFRRKGTAGYIDIAGVKLEEGNKATEWSPSPFDTLYASTITSTYAPKTMVKQTEDRITQTVEATYATKTQLSDEMKQSLKTFELRGRMDGDYWLKMGRVTMAQQGKDFHIDYTGGRGFNGDTGQNSQLEIHVRSSNGGGRLFAVTLNRLLNADMYQIKAFAIDTTHIDLYIKSGSQYSTGTMAYYGQYSDFSGAVQIDDISAAEGTELTVLEQSLSTKTYVQQTAESVSIGVVEDFKDGLHGDKLTTQSNLTALKNEITASVSEQYADLSDQIKLLGSENVVGKNFSFESNNFDGWASHDRWAIGTNGAHTGRYYAQNTIPANSNGNQLISMGSIAAEYGHTYKLEYWVKKKPNTQCRGVHRISYKRSGVWEDMPSDVGTTMFLDDEGKTNINVGANGGFFDVTDSWTKVTAYIIPPSNVTELRVRIIGNNPGSAETVFAVDDVSLTDYSVAKTINKTMAGISVKADSITQEVRENYATKDLVNRSIPGLKNPNFDVQKDGDYHTIAGWSSNGPWTEVRLGNSAPVSSSEGGTYFIGKSGTTAGQTLELINQGYISAYPGMKVQISWWMFVDSNIIKDSNFSAGIIANNVVTRNLLNNYSTGGWKYMTTTITVPANVNQFRVRFGFVTTGTSGWLRLDSVSVTDVTEANAALGKANTAIRTLDEYKSTVSNTYATKDTVTQMQSQWTQTTQGFEASIKKTEKDISAVSGSMTVINGTFETHDTTGWAMANFKNTSVTNGSIYQNSSYRFLGYRSGNNRPTLRNEGTITARKGDFVKVSARILLLNSANTSIDGSMRIGVRNSHSGVPYLGNMTIMAGGWNTVSYNAQIPEDGTYCLLMDFPNTIAESTKILVDDVIMSNETEAIHADTRINALETRIAMTAKGVRVGKITDGNFVGMSALVNSEGSFDILNGEQVQSTMSDSNVGLMRDASTGKYRFQIKPYAQNGKNGTNLLSYGQLSVNSMPTIPATTAVDCNLPNGQATVNTGSEYVIPWYTAGQFQTNGLIISDPVTYRTNYYQTVMNGEILDDKAYKYAVAILGTSGDACKSLVFLNPGLYAVQYNAHVQHTAKAYFDYCLRFKAPGASSFVKIAGAPDWRAIEVDDPAGYLQRTSIVAWVYVDAGTQMQLHVKSSVNNQKLSIGNRIHITRMPFGCVLMN